MLSEQQRKHGLSLTIMASVDKKIGRLKAKTWGRTTGGYSPKYAKLTKRRGSKGSRRVAKQELKI